MKLFLITIVTMLSQWVLVGPAAETTPDVALLHSWLQLNANDRKFGARPPEACKDMVNGIATNTYNVLEQNPWLIIRYEVPNEFVEQGLFKIIIDAIKIEPRLKSLFDQGRICIKVAP